VLNGLTTCWSGLAGDSGSVVKVTCSRSAGTLDNTMTNIDHFQLLNSRLDRFRVLGSQPGPIGFLGQEALRFHSIAGTLKANGMVGNSSDDERYISHILARSLI